jgi:hypothetical protein
MHVMVTSLMLLANFLFIFLPKLLRSLEEHLSYKKLALRAPIAVGQVGCLLLVKLGIFSRTNPLILL